MNQNTAINFQTQAYRTEVKRPTLTLEQRIKLMQKWLAEHADFAWTDSYKQYQAELKELEAAQA